jgi:hypothetical protein
MPIPRYAILREFGVRDVGGPGTTAEHCIGTKRPEATVSGNTRAQGFRSLGLGEADEASRASAALRSWCSLEDLGDFRQIAGLGQKIRRPDLARDLFEVHRPGNLER